MFKRFLALPMVVCASILVASCADKAPVQRLPELSFADRPGINLDVAQLEIVSEYQPPGREPNYEHLMPLSPEAATIRWAKERLHPVGRKGTARVIIKDARVLHTNLKTDKSISGMFKDEQAEKYDGSLEVTVELQDERHLPIADVNARATKMRTLNEDATVNEREKALYDISTSMAKDIDMQMDGLIRNYMGKWIVVQ